MVKSVEGGHDDYSLTFRLESVTGLSRAKITRQGLTIRYLEPQIRYRSVTIIQLLRLLYENSCVSHSDSVVLLKF